MFAALNIERKSATLRIPTGYQTKLADHRFIKKWASISDQSYSGTAPFSGAEEAVPGVMHAIASFNWPLSKDSGAVPMLELPSGDVSNSEPLGSWAAAVCCFGAGRASWAVWM